MPQTGIERYSLMFSRKPEILFFNARECENSIDIEIVTTRGRDTQVDFTGDLVLYWLEKLSEL